MLTLTLILLVPQGRFFENPPVDFWGTRPAPSAEERWREGTHVPPAPVVRLLDTPGRESARAYLRWQEERLARLTAALRALEEARAEGRSTKREILYFVQEGCLYCSLQDRELENSDLDGWTLRRVRPGESPDLWARHRVTGTPTLVVGDRLFRGLTSRRELEQAVRP